MFSYSQVANKWWEKKNFGPKKGLQLYFIVKLNMKKKLPIFLNRISLWILKERDRALSYQKENEKMTLLERKWYDPVIPKENGEKMIESYHTKRKNHTNIYWVGNQSLWHKGGSKKGENCWRKGSKIIIHTNGYWVGNQSLWHKGSFRRENKTKEKIAFLEEEVHNNNSYW